MTTTDGKGRICSFGYRPGDVIADKYEVVRKLGGGYEGEVYRVREKSIGVERAAKLFFPHRNMRNRAVRFYARKLHKLRDCPILIQYHTQEKIIHDDKTVTMLVSEYVDGMLLSRFVKAQPGKRMRVFEAMHLLHTLASGVERIHLAKEYHGDLHDDNVIVRRRGIYFDVKLVDMYNWGVPNGVNIKDDVVNLVRIFYDCLGGQRVYASQPPEVKYIISGLKRSIIHRKFHSAKDLRWHLESFEWEG